MMKRSFAEIDSAQDESDRLRSLEELSMRLASCETIVCDYCTESVQHYYNKCKQITELRGKMQVSMFIEAVELGETPT